MRLKHAVFKNAGEMTDAISDKIRVSLPPGSWGFDFRQWPRITILYEPYELSLVIDEGNRMELSND